MSWVKAITPTACNCPVSLALGGTVSTFAKPDILDSYFGKNPMGYTVFARFSLGD